MNRLQSELHRLYLTQSAADAQHGTSPPEMIGASGAVRALVFELALPASWERLSTVWRGVQTDFEFPAPAIAVSGTDGLQLWFSLAEPVEAARGHVFLEGLRSRFLPDIAANRIRLMPAADASARQPRAHACLVPALQANGQDWSAFIAPDLAPVFADTPWLDVPPSEEGQAALLHGLETTKSAAFESALQRLGASAQQPHATAAVAGAEADPKRFLLHVMNDATVALVLRIDAAKALLQHATRT